jgi:predicted alpha/beta-fold hydrolase
MTSSARNLFSDFRPLPLLGNPHIQTLLAHLIGGAKVRLPTRRSILWLPDGDGLVLHDTAPPGWSAPEPIAVVVHGLSGSHSSGTVQRVSVFLLNKGVRVVRMDQRGAGAGASIARGCYHGGRSDDLRAVLEEVHRWSPGSPILLLGISLGGNVSLKLAGEAVDRPVPGLGRIAVISPPIDLARCAALLAQRRNRIYERRFIVDLITEVRLREKCFPDLPPARFPSRPTMRQFDDLYTAPRNGFQGADDYYRRASSASLIDRITVPTLVLTSRDDPFIAVEPFEVLRLPSHVSLRIVPQGGHIGFLGPDGAGGFRWAERRVTDWLTSG